MHPVVIDTNCLLQIISRNSPYRPIWDAFLVGKFDLCVSNDILEEYQEILNSKSLRPLQKTSSCLFSTSRM